ncbi:class I SAM-dependent methyltransferase [Methylocella sp.]|uniref:class I SAM-dependent methyltransferase n=1 Tax=Methylocella sp. TaxID=1978226 RepID=UPI00378335F2
MTHLDHAPPCPVTGAPAAFVQSVGCGFLAKLWKIEFGVDAGPSLAGHDRLSLWRSPTGLMFFDPAPEGDARFYKSFYARLGDRALPGPGRPRAEYEMAARLAPRGGRVLDVGAGAAQAFRPFCEGADYHAFDPHFSPGSAFAEDAGFDLVCAFQVIEHVARPAPFFARMAQAARPGGRVALSVPHAPSAMTRLPNFLMNAPPHHLTWWTRDALEALCAREGLEAEAVLAIPWGPIDSLIFWASRCTPGRRALYYRAAWSWHAAALLGFALGFAANAAFGPPRPTRDEGAGLLLIARKPL